MTSLTQNFTSRPDRVVHTQLELLGYLSPGKRVRDERNSGKGRVELAAWKEGNQNGIKMVRKGPTTTTTKGYQNIWKRNLDVL